MIDDCPESDPLWLPERAFELAKLVIAHYSSKDVERRFTRLQRVELPCHVVKKAATYCDPVGELIVKCVVQNVERGLGISHEESEFLRF